MSSASDSTLGIIAGSGSLPAQLVAHCRAKGRPFFVLAYEDAADLEALRDTPHAVVRLGAVGEAIEHLKNAGAEELVMAGKVKRPSLFSLKPDALGKKLMTRLGGALFGGDDAVLKTIIGFLEESGFRVVGSDDVMGALLTPVGVLTKTQPGAAAKSDIAFGLKIAKSLGALDIGQAVIVENNYVLGVEAAEGTDELVRRCGQYRREERSGVLVKVKKPQQEQRVDLPAIGADTVQRVHDEGFAGIAVEANASLILDREKTLQKADKLGIFIVGAAHE